MTGRNKPGLAYLAIRFSLEFVVVVLGISVSFWVNEWSEEREAIRQRTTDAFELLDDLNIDGTRIERVLEPSNKARSTPHESCVTTDS